MEGHGAHSLMPALLVAGPLAASLLVRPLGKKSEALRNAFCTLVTALTFLGAASLVPLVREARRVWFRVPLLLGEVTFDVDIFGLLFALFTSFLWLVSTVYSLDYLRHGKNRDRYHSASLAVLAANMGVVLAGDWVTLYLFFELLGIVAYLLVVHAGTEEARKASAKYLWMTLAGGFALLAGILLVPGLGSTGVIGPVTASAGTGAARWAAGLLMILGFGVKAGMVPVHVWLPDAHPVAPSPASALLSGVMIKAGAYGIFRVVSVLFAPSGSGRLREEAVLFIGRMGLAVLWAGIVTMLVGVVLALLQENAKRMLAYHSISQMGFILAGIGAAGYLGGHAATGYSGGLYHVVNHALFKACLFLGVGAVFHRTGELNMYRLGGLWKRMPLTFLFTLVAAFGITGMPGFNGFVSKTLIHHALVESYHLHGRASLRLAEVIFTATCGGTVCSFMKLVILVFLGKPRAEYPDVAEAPPRMLLAMGALAVPIVVLGIAPRILLGGVFSPGLHELGIHAAPLAGFRPLSGGNLLSVLPAFAIGAAVYVAGMRFGLFHLHVPGWMSVDSWYTRGYHGLVSACVEAAGRYDSLRRAVSGALASRRTALAGALKAIGERRRRLGESLRLADRLGRLGASAAPAVRRCTDDLGLSAAVIAALFLLYILAIIAG